MCRHGILLLLNRVKTWIWVKDKDERITSLKESVELEQWDRAKTDLLTKLFRPHSKQNLKQRIQIEQQPCYLHFLSKTRLNKLHNLIGRLYLRQQAVAYLRNQISSNESKFRMLQHVFKE